MFEGIVSIILVTLYAKMANPYKPYSQQYPYNRYLINNVEDIFLLAPYSQQYPYNLYLINNVEDIFQLALFTTIPFLRFSMFKTA